MISQDDYEEVLQMRRELAVLRADWMLTLRAHYARKYSPDQPRVPAGSREGGQWTDGNGGGGINDSRLFRTPRRTMTGGPARNMRPPKKDPKRIVGIN